MIIKGNSRSGPKQLARHLLRTDTNERVIVLENKSMHTSLFQTFRDWQLLASGTRGTKGLYHANIDPDARYAMTPEQWQRSVDVLEKELGLDGQPRVVVMHKKEGREHVHVVWQRTDIDTMTLRSDSLNYPAHERASLQLEKEFGHEHVPGKHAKRDKTKDMPRSEYNHAEMQHAERTGIDPDERREDIASIYKRCDNGAAFKQALEEEGYIVARGDKRNFVLIDEDGAVFSLSRQIRGVKAKELNAFMADVDRDALPPVDEAKARQEESRARSGAPEEEPEETSKLSPEVLVQYRNTLKTWHEEDMQKLRADQDEEQARTAQALDHERDEKLAAVDARQKAALDRYDREHRIERRGFMGWVANLWDRITPARAAAEARAREEARQEIIHDLAQERVSHEAEFQRAKAMDLSDLAERHAQIRREQETQFQEEFSRRLRDYEEAQRLLARLSEQRRLQEEEQLKQAQGPPGRAR